MPPEQKKAKGKRLGGLPLWAWGLSLGGAVGLYLLYRRYEANSAANAALAAQTAGGQSPGETVAQVPTTGSTANSGGSSASTAPATLSAWEQAALSAMTSAGLDAGDAYNAVSDFISGNCVSSAAFTGLSGALSSLGLPPGMTSFQPLSVCAKTPTPTAPAGAEAGVGSFGSAQITALQQQLAAGAITASEYADVVGAFMSAGGPGSAAEDLHYIWNGPGNVTTIPAVGGGTGGPTVNPPRPTSASTTPSAPEANVGLFGSAQIANLQSQLNAGAISSQEYQDVTNAYQQAGAGAESLHFVWNGPGNVTTVAAA